MAGVAKVVHVVRRFAPGTWGGAESAVLYLSRELAAAGVESPVFCTDLFAEPGPARLDGVAVRRFRCVLPWLGLSAEAKAKLRLKGGSPLSLPLFIALVREKNVSVIHTHVQHRLGGMARTAAKWKRIPYVVSLHGGWYAVPEEQVRRMMAPFRGKLEWGKVFGWLFGARRVLNDAAAIVCVGADEYAEVRRRFPFKNVFQVPNGVCVERFAQADGASFRHAHGFAPSDKIVLCVSRIDYQKDQLGLVRAFAAFARNHPCHRLVLLGPATVEEYRREVEEEIGRLGLAGRVRLVGALPPGDPLLPGAYKAAEMFVLASRHEPFGIVVLEAWAARVPVVASRTGGIPGFAADRRTILFAAPGDVADLAARMAELADAPALREALASAAFAEVSAKYGWHAVAARMREVYGAVAGGAGA